MHTHIHPHMCTQRVRRLVASTAAVPNEPNCESLKSLMFVHQLEDMDKVLETKYFSERIEPTFHLIDCQRATFHMHTEAIGMILSVSVSWSGRVLFIP